MRFFALTVFVCVCVKVRAVSEELEGVAAEREGLERACQSSKEEAEELRLQLSSEREELVQLQGALQSLRQDKEQQRSQLEQQVRSVTYGDLCCGGKALMVALPSLQISSMEEKQREQEELMLQQQSETGRREASFQQQVAASPHTCLY